MQAAPLRATHLWKLLGLAGQFPQALQEWTCTADSDRDDVV